MWEYAILMLAVTTLLFAVAIRIYRENTKLIHDYHQTKAKDKKGYGRAFGKALMVLSMAPLVSGIVALFGTSNKIAIISVIILAIGLSIGIIIILSVQKKYNKGIF